MAFIRLKNNKGRIVSPEQGLEIWRVLVGEIKGTKEQQEFVKTVHGVYLNPTTAPKKYLDWRNKQTKLEPRKQARMPYVD
jgi:hypothetical protein